jgi:hypothetical protein
MTLLIRRLPVLLSPLLLGLGPISVSYADFTDPKLVLHMVQGSGLPSDCSRMCGADQAFDLEQNQVEVSVGWARAHGDPR